MTTATTSHIRWMIRTDLSAVLAIEQASYDGDSWNEADFIYYLRQRSCIGIVAEVGDEVAAFALYELHPDWLSLDNVAVHPKHRRNGIGEAMVSRLKYKLVSHRRDMMTLTIHEGNLSAQQFFRRQGFRAVRTIRRFFDCGADAYEMEFRLGGAE
jgi:ribosomal-protein-alanine N-acetyltransferase